MWVINWFVRLFWQNNKGFDAKKELKKIRDDFSAGKGHYFDTAGQLTAKFGANAFPIINPSGEYGDFLPVDEYQNIGSVETFACTVFATLKAIAIIIKLKYGITVNYSERFIAILANINPNSGGSPHTVAEAIRKYGLIPQEMLPFNDGMSSKEFYTKPDNWNELLEEGRKWLEQYNFGHEWINDFSHKNITEKSKTSPTPAGVHAWFQKNGIYFKPSYERDNHWCLRFGEVENQYHKFRDSYEPWEKHIDWDYPFAFMKRYYVEKKNQDDVEIGKGLYNRLKGKHIALTQKDGVNHGEIFHVKDNYELSFEGWGTNSDWLQEKLNVGLRDAEKKGEYIGVSDKDWVDLKVACVLAGGKMTPDEDTVENIKDLINQLK